MEQPVIHVYYSCKSGMAPAFVQALKQNGLQAAVQAEDGCMQYDYHLSCEEADTVLLLEKWRDAAALDKHLTQPHMADIGKLKEQFVDSTRVEKYL